MECDLGGLGKYKTTHDNDSNETGGGSFGI